MKELTVEQNEWKAFIDDFGKRNQLRLMRVKLLGEMMSAGL